jgi:hypothetical protein
MMDYSIVKVHAHEVTENRVSETLAGGGCYGHLPLHDAHDLGNESFQMEDMFLGRISIRK